MIQSLAAVCTPSRKFILAKTYHARLERLTQNFDNRPQNQEFVYVETFHLTIIL